MKVGRERHEDAGLKDGSGAATSQGALAPQMLEAAGMPLPRASEGRRSCPHADLSPLTPILGAGLQNYKKIYVCCFKPPSLWLFVTAAAGHSYRASCSKGSILCLEFNALWSTPLNS